MNRKQIHANYAAMRTAYRRGERPAEIAKRFGYSVSAVLGVVRSEKQQKRFRKHRMGTLNSQELLNVLASIMSGASDSEVSLRFGVTRATANAIRQRSRKAGLIT